MIYKRHLMLLAAGLLASICSAATSESAAETPGNQKLRQLMEQRRVAAAGQAAGYASATGPTPARLQERADLLVAGETALS